MAKPCRCTRTSCRKRFKGAPGVSKCPACGRVGQLDRWYQSKPWTVCHCDAYPYPHHQGYGECCGGRLQGLPLAAGIELPF